VLSNYFVSCKEDMTLTYNRQGPVQSHPTAHWFPLLAWGSYPFHAQNYQRTYMYVNPCAVCGLWEVSISSLGTFLRGVRFFSKDLWDAWE